MAMACMKIGSKSEVFHTPTSVSDIAVEKSLTQPQHESETSVAESSSSSSSSSSSDAVFVSVFSDHLMSNPAMISSTAAKPQQRNRCGSCRKRVWLTGFTCKCGTTFCGIHRYPEKHDCSFDFKTVRKEAIAKAKTVVKAAMMLNDVNDDAC